MTVHGISIDEAGLADLCRRHHIRRLALFGSVLGPTFGPESDVDVLVEFETNARPGLSFFGMGEELEEILGRKVDFLTPGFLSDAFRDDVLREAEPVFVAA